MIHANTSHKNYKRKTSARHHRLARRRKERSRLIYSILKHLYGETKASSMWSTYLRTLNGSSHSRSGS